ncbi:MAG: phosphoribosylformylglycinamidine cyclo-ligase [bacterium]
MTEESLTYRQAGVDIEKGEKFSQWIKKKITSFTRAQLLPAKGGFAGLYSLDRSPYKHPVLVATTDGVGTKLKIAHQFHQHHAVGIDLVAMCVNDLLTQGARPLFFLDYLATGKLSLSVGKEIVSGIIEGCKKAECTLLGGETAEMPSLYGEEEYDLAGFAVGIVEKENLDTASQVKPGDKIIGLPSSGLHSNGFSLVRKIFFEKKSFRLTHRIKTLGRTLGEELLEPTRIYTHPILYLVSRFKIKGIAHITGGGLIRNIGRILPSGCEAQIYQGNWEPHPIFRLIQKEGSISEKEMFRVFNMGMGMVLIISPHEEKPILKALSDQGEKAKIIGRIAAGKRGVKIKKALHNRGWKLSQKPPGHPGKKHT